MYVISDDNNNTQLIAIEAIINSILPTPVTPTKSFTTRSGYRFDYPNETDVNHFFNIDVLAKLHEQHLTPNLCHETQKHRLVFIPNVQRESYYQSHSILQSLLNEVNNINIIKVETFLSKKDSSRKYIKIFLDSHEAQTNLIRRERITLDQVSYRVEAPHSKNDTAHLSRPQPPSFNNRQNSNRPQGPSALSRFSNWGGNRQYTHHNVTQQSSQHANHQLNLPDTRDFSYNNSRLCEALYHGLEHPETYIYFYNQILIHNGHSVINVPQIIIDKSRNMFLQRRSTCIPPPPVAQTPATLDTSVPPPPLLTPASSDSHPSLPPISPQPPSAPPESPLQPPLTPSAPPESPILFQPPLPTSIPPPISSNTPQTPLLSSVTSSTSTPTLSSPTTSNHATSPSTYTANSSLKRPLPIQSTTSLTPIQSTYLEKPHLSTGSRNKPQGKAPYMVSNLKSSLLPSSNTPTTSSKSKTPISQPSTYPLRPLRNRAHTLPSQMKPKISNKL